MSIEQNMLPMRKKGQQQIIDVRPAYVEDWLETLPYADFAKTVTLLTEAVKASNQVAMKASQRFELVTLYHRSYEYYIETQIRNLANQATLSVGQQFIQAENMKRFAIQLAHACKITANESLHSKTLFGQAKHPVQATLMSMTYLSHALIYSFLEYSPVPKKVWSELNSLYEFASGINQQHTTIKLIGNSGTTTTVEHVYKQILLTSVSDPLHLPFGCVWDVYKQLNIWSESAQLQKFKQVDDPAGYFVINIKKDMQPLPYSKFDVKLASQDHLLLDANALRKTVRDYLQALEAGEVTDENFILSNNTAKTLLAVLNKSWGLTAKRYYSRESITGKLNVASGLNACYYFHNNEDDLVQRLDQFQTPDISVDEDDPELRQAMTYVSDQWEISDRSSGGCCISKSGHPKTPPRVGDLVGLQACNNGGQPHWVLTVLRWLMVSQQGNYKAGIQTLSSHAQAVTIRALTGNPSHCEVRRAFLTDDPNKGESDKVSNLSVVTNRGLYAPQRELEIMYKNKPMRVTAQNLLESNTAFEQFSFKKI